MVTTATGAGAWDGALDVFVLAVGVGCGWLGWRAARWPGRAVGPVRPGWVTRAWGLGYLLLGCALVVDTATRLAGGEQRWATHLLRWGAGPLVIGSLLATFVIRRRERRASDG
ncbi:hypothetical protein [Streptomyces buecherae]|uniref:hypothetical protein n=1 Tax=Streptomyces buecherae TaxID=2763006 RepID=UPI001C273206|nr:hypothetical protein [Streptomyces buecherae]